MNITELIENSFKPHLFIEFYYSGDRMFLSEHMLGESAYHLLLEQYGIFPGCREMANEILNHVNILKTGKKQTPIHFINLWVNTVYIKSDNNISQAAYELTTCKWNKSKNNFDSIIIDLNINNIKQSSFYPLIMHELTHAYQDYQLRLKGSSLLDSMQNYGVDKNNLVFINSYEETKQKLAWVIYHLNDFERSSYVAQIGYYFNNVDRVFNNIGEVMEFLKDTIPYKNYQMIFEWCSELYSIEDGKSQSQILTWVEQLSNLEFLSYKKFRNWLKEKQLRYQNKFNTIIPKIAYQHLNMVEYTTPNFDSLIKINKN